MKKKLLVFISLLAFQAGFSQAWTPIGSPTQNNIVSCSFVNQNLGWIIAGKSIHKTTDGGATWTDQEFPADPPDITRVFTSVHFINENTGIISCGNYVYSNEAQDQMSTILWTNDGGQHWAYKDVGGDGSYDLSAILVSPQIAYSIGQYGQSKKTTDAGATWTPLNFSGVGYSGSQLFALDANHVYFAGLQNLSLIAAFGRLSGNTWLVQNFASAMILNGIFFKDATHGWVAGPGGLIKFTTNEGQSWTDCNSGTTDDIRGIAFKDVQKGWAITSTGNVLKSVNGGFNWALEYSGDEFLSDISVDAQTGIGYAVGASGTILKYNPNLSLSDVQSVRFSIFPNPAKGIAHISVPDGSTIESVEIFDAVGKKVESVRLSQQSSSFDTAHLETGIYYVRMRDSRGLETSEKLIIAN